MALAPETIGSSPLVLGLPRNSTLLPQLSAALLQLSEAGYMAGGQSPILCWMWFGLCMYTVYTRSWSACTVSKLPCAVLCIAKTVGLLTSLSCRTCHLRCLPWCSMLSLQSSPTDLQVSSICLTAAAAAAAELRRKWFVETSRCEAGKDRGASGKGQLHLTQSWTLFLIMAVGAGVALLAAAGEMLYYSRLHTREWGAADTCTAGAQCGWKCVNSSVCM